MSYCNLNINSWFYFFSLFFSYMPFKSILCFQSLLQFDLLESKVRSV